MKGETLLNKEPLVLLGLAFEPAHKVFQFKSTRFTLHESVPSSSLVQSETERSICLGKIDV